MPFFPRVLSKCHDGSYSRKDLELISIKHDVFSSENKLVNAGKVEEVVKLLDEKKAMYTPGF